MGLLIKATQALPIGTAYAVWTGIGAALAGILIFKEPATFLRSLFITTLIGPVIRLKVKLTTTPDHQGKRMNIYR